MQTFMHDAMHIASQWTPDASLTAILAPTGSAARAMLRARTTQFEVCVCVCVHFVDHAPEDGQAAE